MEPYIGFPADVRDFQPTPAAVPSRPSRRSRAEISKSTVVSGLSAFGFAQLRACQLRRRANPSDLEKEAARIRAEALALEEEQKQQRRETRALEWADGRKSVPVADLRRKLAMEEKVDLTESEVRNLLESKEASIAFLSTEDFEIKLQMLISAKRETARALAAAAAKEREAQAQAESIKQEIDNVFANEVEGEDVSFGTRLVACLVYILPLMDGFHFGLPLLEFFPAAMPVVKLIAPLLMLKNAIPFGTFIFLILFQALARNGDFPQILRFNLAQAVVLDVLFIIPDFFMSIISMELPTSLLVALFVILFGVMVYSVTLTMLGKVPDGLGGISDMTRRNLGRY